MGLSFPGLLISGHQGEESLRSRALGDSHYLNAANTDETGKITKKPWVEADGIMQEWRAQKIQFCE
jgi:hypothetical protein